MNDAQLFIIFSAILVFGWLGFFAGKAFENNLATARNVSTVICFMLGTMAFLMTMMINLGSLVFKNWQP